MIKAINRAFRVLRLVIRKQVVILDNASDDEAVVVYEGRYSKQQLQDIATRFFCVAYKLNHQN